MKPLAAAQLSVIIILAAYSVFFIVSSDIFSREKMKVLVIGIDALDPKLMEKMMEEGRLPNFRRLSEEGSYARLRTTTPPETPVAWSAAATGMNPGEYGIYDFIARDPETYLPRLNTARQTSSEGYESALRGKPFWEITSENGIPTTVIRWPITFPAGKVKGRMLSGLGTPDIKGLLNSYRFYTSENMTGDKIIRVSAGHAITTKLYGPMVQKGGKIVESEKDMTINIKGKSAAIVIDGAEHEVKEGGWSAWIRAKFDAGLFRNVHGIFRVYLNSAEPFGMYMSSVQVDPENQLVKITYPESYGSELVKEMGLFHTLGMPEETKALEDGRLPEEAFLQQIKDIEEEREEMFWLEFGRFDGVLAFGFDASDRLQHVFWSGRQDVVEDYYADKDRLVGEILGRLDNDTRLIIFSDHGFSRFDRAVSINTWLIQNGYMSVTEGEDKGELFSRVDWENTKAYSVGFTSIYINEKGRERDGIVEGKKKLIDEIISKLSNLEDPATGKKVITSLYKGIDIYSGKFAGEAPDIVIGFEPGYRMSSDNAVGGFSPEIISDNTEKWKGDHLIDPSHVPGVMFTNFRTSGDPSLVDIAPTILGILDIPENMEGDSLAT